MYTAQKTRKENIAEYILYLWQLEDLLRALQFSPEAIYAKLVKPLGLPEEQKQEVFLWYMDIVNLLREEGKDDLLEKVQEEFKEHAGEPPLASVEETLLRERGEDALLRAIRRESDDVVGMSGGKGGDEDKPRD